MMTLDTLRKRLSVLIRVVAADDPMLYECRHCGTWFDTNPEGCPQCGATSIASYHPSTFH